MVLTLTGNTEKGAHVWSEPGPCVSNLLNAFVYIKSGHKPDLLFFNKDYFPSHVRNGLLVTIYYKYHFFWYDQVSDYRILFSQTKLLVVKF